MILFDAPNKEFSLERRKKLIEAEKALYCMCLDQMAKAQAPPPPPPVPQIGDFDTEIKRIRDYKELMSELVMDERDKILIKDTARNLFLAHYSGEKKTTENKEVTVSIWLYRKGIFGTDLKKGATVFGKFAVEAFRELNKTDPPKKEEYIDGRLIPVNCYYTPKDDHVLNIAFQRWNHSKKQIK